MSSVLSTGICPHDIWSQTVFWKKRAKCRTGWSIARGASHYWHGCKATLTAPAFILLADQMGWSVSRWLTRAIRRVQIQLQVSKIYLVSYLSVINVSVWEALLRPAPPTPITGRGHGWDPTWRSIPTSARFWEGVNSDTILLSSSSMGRGDGVWYIHCKYTETQFKFLISTLRGSQRY